MKNKTKEILDNIWIGIMLLCMVLIIYKTTMIAHYYITDYDPDVEVEWVCNNIKINQDKWYLLLDYKTDDQVAISNKNYNVMVLWNKKPETFKLLSRVDSNNVVDVTYNSKDHPKEYNMFLDMVLYLEYARVNPNKVIISLNKKELKN